MRNLFYYRGKRIRARDQHLVYHTILLYGGLLFLILLLPFHFRSLLATNWQKITLESIIQQVQSVYLWISIGISLSFCCGIGLLYHYYQIDRFKQLQHRQKLARMVLQNGWVEMAKSKQESFFKDIATTQEKTKISHFPKMYYRIKNGLIHIEVEISMGKYQDQLLHLENKLESGLYCELVEKNLKESYVEYILLYDTIGSRIAIQEVVATDGALKLMDSVWWEYDKLPHMLIAGGTGSGKSYFILTLIEALLKTDAQLYILDPKNADLADLSTVMPNVYFRKEEMLNCIDAFYYGMIARSEEMKRHPNYKTGGNYADLGLPANFLIFDEYVAMMDMLGRDSASVITKLKQIVMLGRQAGFFLILACQRPDAKYFSEGIRDNFNFRVALGRMSELGYGMMFGSDTQKQFFLKPIKGRGYVDTGKSVISEFYTPYVPKNHDFLQNLKQILKEKNQSFDGTAEQQNDEKEVN